MLLWLTSFILNIYMNYAYTLQYQALPLAVSALAGNVDHRLSRFALHVQ